MTREEMDRAAHRLLMQEKLGSNLSFSRNTLNNPSVLGSPDHSRTPSRLDNGRSRGQGRGVDESDVEFGVDSDTEIQ